MLHMGSSAVERRLELAEINMQINSHLVKNILTTLGFVIALFNGYEYKEVEPTFLAYLTNALNNNFKVETRSQGIHILVDSTISDYHGLYRLCLKDGKVSFAGYTLQNFNTFADLQGNYPLLPPLDEAKRPEMKMDCDNCPLTRMATEKF